MKIVIAGQVFDPNKTPITFVFENGLEARGVILAMTTSIAQNGEGNPDATIDDVVCTTLRGFDLAHLDTGELEAEANLLAGIDWDAQGFCTKTNSTCLAKAGPTEPIFVFRAKDPLAAFAVKAWIQAATVLGLHSEKMEDAHRALDAFAAWRKPHSSLEEVISGDMKASRGWNRTLNITASISPTLPLTEDTARELKVSWEDLIKDFMDFSDATFGKDNARACIIQLKKEVKELEEAFDAAPGTLSNMDRARECVDVINCCLSILKRIGYDENWTRWTFGSKLLLLKQRKWIANDDGTLSHDPKHSA